MKTTYSIKTGIKYPKTNEKGENTFNLKDKANDVKAAIEKFNQKHQGNKSLKLNKVDANLLDLNLESSKRLNKDNMGKELTYLSRVLKQEYGWGEFSKYDSAFLNIEELSIIPNKEVSKGKITSKNTNKTSKKEQTNAQKSTKVKEKSEIDKQIDKISKIAKETVETTKVDTKKSTKRPYNRKNNNKSISVDVSKSNKKAIDKIVSLGKEMLDESFKMSVSELIVMKEETKSIEDMKDIVVNLENIIDLLEKSNKVVLAKN